MSGYDPEVEESLRSTVKYQARFIKAQSNKINRAIDLIDELSQELDDSEFMSKLEQIMEILTEHEEV